ncbi:MAG: hypothetical protein AAB368_09030, partial [bacterium]
ARKPLRDAGFFVCGRIFVIARLGGYPDPYLDRLIVAGFLGLPRFAGVVLADGGRRGPNRVAWDGRNGAGESVAMGGYIAQIRMDSSEGLATAIRKIGVVW